MLLVQQIITLARRERWTVGYHIMEEALSSQLKVSRSPVRAALKALAERKVVELVQHRGCFLLMDHVQLDKLKLQALPSSVDQLYSQVIKDRISGALPPSFTQTEAMRRYDAPRTTLEEVLRRLAQDSLIVRNKGQGWSFSPTLDSRQSRQTSYAFRLLLEPAAILMEGFQAHKPTLQRLRESHTSLIFQLNSQKVGDAVIYEADVDFHRSVASFTGNPFVIDALEQQNRLRHLLEYSSYANKERVIQWCHEHLDIIEALEKEDYRKASALMRRHIVLAAAATITLSQPPARDTGRRRHKDI